VLVAVQAVSGSSRVRTLPTTAKRRNRVMRMWSMIARGGYVEVWGRKGVWCNVVDQRGQISPGYDG
jgi:hypothetical protein